VLHCIATFHSAGRSAREAPDLMLWLSDPNGPVGSPELFQIEVVLLRPRSRGVVRLQSANPADAPWVELPSLSDPSDIERLAEAYERAVDVAGQPMIRALCSERPAPDARGEDASELIRANSYSL